MDDNKLWSVFHVCAVVMVISLSVAGKGCNDSDNALYNNAIQKGCDVRHTSRGHQVLCGSDRHKEALD